MIHGFKIQNLSFENISGNGVFSFHFAKVESLSLKRFVDGIDARTLTTSGKDVVVATRKCGSQCFPFI